MREIKNKIAIVTGGGSGIGRGSSIALALAGANVVVADMDLAGAQDTVLAIKEQGGKAKAVACDVSNDSALDGLRDDVLAQFGNIHIIMNNVGVLTRGLPEHLPLEEWRRILDINLLSVVRSNLAFVPYLKERGEGHIVNTASFAGLYTYAFDRMPYAATKAAIVQISEGMRLYLKPFGVGVTCLCPGPVKTNIAADVRSFGPATETRGPGQQFALLDPLDVGTMAVRAIQEERFMVPTDDLVWPLLKERADNWDGFLDRMDEGFRP